MPKVTIRMLATQDGFYAGTRRRAGTEFDYEADVTYDANGIGDYKRPSWMQPATETHRRVFEKMKKDHEERMLRAAIASSGQGVIGRAAMDAKVSQFAEASNRAHVGKPIQVSTASGTKAPGTIKGGSSNET